MDLATILAATAPATAAALAAASLAGAIGLGLASLAIVGRGRGRKTTEHIYLHHSGGGHGSSYGYGSDGYGVTTGHNWRRKKRSLKEDDDAKGRVMELIRKEDSSGCGLRLVCEIAAVDEEQLAMEELAILNMVGPIVRPGEGLLPGTAADEYRLARTYGSWKQDCSQIYHNCPIDGEQLVEAVMAYIP